MDGTPTTAKNGAESIGTDVRGQNTHAHPPSPNVAPTASATGQGVRIRDSREIDSRILALAIHWHYADNSVEADRLLAQIAALYWVAAPGIDWGEAWEQGRSAAIGFLLAEGLTKRKGGES